MPNTHFARSSRMGASMRRLVLLLSTFVLVSAIGAAQAQTEQPAKRTSARQKAAQKPATLAPDTRPRYKRDDTPAAVAAQPAKPVVAHKKRTARKPAGGAQPDAATQTARTTARDITACAQNKDH